MKKKKKTLRMHDSAGDEGRRSLQPGIPEICLDVGIFFRLISFVVVDSSDMF